MKSKSHKKSDIRVVDPTDIIQTEKGFEVHRVKVRLNLNNMTLSQLSDIDGIFLRNQELFKGFSKILEGTENVLKAFHQRVESINGIFLSVKMMADKFEMFNSSLSRGIVVFNKLFDADIKLIQGVELGSMIGDFQESNTYTLPRDIEYIDYELSISQRLDKLDYLCSEVSLIREELISIKESTRIGSIEKTWTFDNDTALLEIGGVEISFLGAGNQRKLLEGINSNKNKTLWGIDEIVEAMEYNSFSYDERPKYWDRFLRQTARNIMDKLVKNGFNDRFVEYRNKTLIIHQIGS